MFRGRLLVLLALVAGLVLAAAPAEPFETFDYDFGLTVVTDPTLGPYQYPVAVHGSVHTPTALGEDHPVVVLMHGRHGTCAVLGVETFGTQACPDAVVVQPVESFRGYDDLAQDLAGRGYVVLSIDANHVNDRDLLGDAGAAARGQLLLETLSEFRSVHRTGVLRSGMDAGQSGALQGRLDLERIGVMGHSRGGQGVASGAKQNLDLPEPFGIRALMAIAPTSFDHAVVVEMPFATILPSCDGDVFNLQGAWMYDNGRHGPHARHQFHVLGANHNWFNTVWTQSDYRGGDEFCRASSEGRFSPGEQALLGTQLVSTFFRVYVGDETHLMAYLSGDVPFPSVRVGERDDDFGVPDVVVSHHPAATDRRSLVTFSSALIPRAGDGGESLILDIRGGVCRGEDCGGPTRADAWMFKSAAGDAGGFTLLLDEPEDWRAWDRICARFAVPPDGGIGDRASIQFVVASGDAVHHAPVTGYPARAAVGDVAAAAVLNMACLDLDDVPDTDLAAVTSTAIEIGRTTVQIADWQLQRVPG